MHSLEVFPGDVGVAGGSGAGGGSTESQDVGPQCGQPLRAKLSVDEIQVSPNDQHCGVRRPRLESTHQTGHGGSEKQRHKQEDLKSCKLVLFSRSVLWFIIV